MTNREIVYPWFARVLHMGMAGFGIAAYLTGELAENGSDSAGYLVHAYLGLSLATFVLVRVLSGVVGSAPLRFSDWSPFSRRQWTLALQDLGHLARLRIPQRGLHEGLAGLTQALGIAIFTWMGATGTGLFLLRNATEGRIFDVIEESHEIGESLIPLYLVLHVGSVILHQLGGDPIWRRMWTFRHKAPPPS